MIDHFLESVLSQNMQAKNVIHIPLVDNQSYGFCQYFRSLWLCSSDNFLHTQMVILISILKRKGLTQISVQCFLLWILQNLYLYSTSIIPQFSNYCQYCDRISVCWRLLCGIHLHQSYDVSGDFVIAGYIVHIVDGFRTCKWLSLLFKPILCFLFVFQGLSLLFFWFDDRLCGLKSV